MEQEGKAMARIIYGHPGRINDDLNIYTDLDFWDARRILGDVAQVKRNFSRHPPGDEFPTRVMARAITRRAIQEIERRLRKAVPSPPI